MADAPLLFEALLALAVNRGPALTVADVNALLADPSAHAEAVAQMKDQIQTELADGSWARFLPSAPASLDHEAVEDEEEDATAGQPALLRPDQPWLSLAAVLYQTAGAYDLPVRVLDLLSAAQHDEPFAHLVHGILPMDTPDHLQLDSVGEVLADLTAGLDEATAETARRLKLARSFVLEAAGGERVAEALDAQAITADGPWTAFLPARATVWLDPTTSPMTPLPQAHPSGLDVLPMAEDDA